MKNKSLIITSIIFLVIIVVTLLMIMVKFINGGSFIMFGHSVSKKKVLEKTYNIYETINIDTNVADINIKENVENNIKVVIYGDEERTNVEEKENKLNVETKMKKCKGFCFNYKIAQVNIYIPTNYKGNIIANNDTGDITVESLENLSLDLITNVGDVDISSIDSAKINSKTGDINIEKINNIIIDTNVGDIKIGLVNKHLDLKSNTGDIKIKKVNLTENSSITNNVGDINIDSTNEIYIDYKTDIGDAKVENNYRKSDVVLKIKNNVGDIKVKN